jgi:hypothetical protein
MNDSPILGESVHLMRDLIARFGAFRVFISYLRAVVLPAPRNSEVPDYLRSDLGLPPRPPDPRLWERYR